MKISETITKLQTVLAKHGDVPVYFDCPECKQSFEPTSLATMATHLTTAPPVPEHFWACVTCSRGNTYEPITHRMDDPCPITGKRFGEPK